MTTILNNKHIKVTQEEVVFPNGERLNDYYLVEKRDYVAIIPIINDLGEASRVILVEQYRPALAKNIWNIPMGFIDDNETPKEAAKRELLEETGYQGELKSLGVFAPAPSFYKAVCHLYIADHCRQVNVSNLDKEIQNMEIFTLSDALNRIQNDKEADMTSIVGLLIAKEKHTL